MKGDVILLSEKHIHAAEIIVSQIAEKVKTKPSRFVITVAGESGSGKSETGLAIANELEKLEIKSILLGQDDYFFFHPNPTRQKGAKIQIGLALTLR